MSPVPPHPAPDATATSPSAAVASSPSGSLAERLERQITWLWWELLRGTSPTMSRTAAAVLATLRDEGPCRVTELAVRERCTQPTMTELVNRLERGGLAVRHPDPDDRRASRVTITAAGDQALIERAEARSTVLRERLARLTPAELQGLEAAIPALERLTDHHDDFDPPGGERR